MTQITNLLVLLLAAQGGKPWNESYAPFQVQDSSLNVQLVGWVDSVGDEIDGLVASEDGKAVYVGAKVSGDTSGLIVVNILDPTHPQVYKVIRHDSLRAINPAVIVDTFLYVWWGDYFGKGTYVGDWDVYGISDPLNPSLIKTIWHYEDSTWEKQPGEMGWASGWVHDTIFYARDEYKSFNIKDPLNPILISWINYGAGRDFFLYPYIYSCGWGEDFPFMIYDVSDPTNMFQTFQGTLYAPYGESPRAIGAWEDPSTQRRYVYMTGMGWSWSLDVTDPYDPEVIHFGDRVYMTHGSVTHGDRFYGLGDLKDLIVYSFKDPVMMPEIGFYDGDSIDWGVLERGVWTNGYLVAASSEQDIVIFRYSGDTIPQDTATNYLDWVRTVYGPPSLQFSLKYESEVCFSLFNVAGQRAYERDLGILEPGPHTVELPRMNPGVYLLLLDANGRKYLERIVFTR